MLKLGRYPPKKIQLSHLKTKRVKYTAIWKKVKEIVKESKLSFFLPRFPPQFFYSLLHNFIIFAPHSWIPSSTILIFSLNFFIPSTTILIFSLNFIIFPPQCCYSFLHNFIIFPPPPPWRFFFLMFLLSNCNCYHCVLPLLFRKKYISKQLVVRTCT